MTGKKKDNKKDKEKKIVRDIYYIIRGFFFSADDENH